MTKLLIIQCRDSLMWYHSLVGQPVPMLKDMGTEGWLSREPAGFTNIVQRSDVALPMGYDAANTGDLIQRGDLLLNGRNWSTSSPVDWGTPVGAAHVIRRTAT